LKLSPEVLEWVALHRTHTKDGDEYIKSLRDDFAGIEPHLPESCESILDIGCGMAGIDILLKRKYPDAKLYLLDGDGPKEDWRGGFEKDMKPFSNREVATAFLASNGVTVDRWYDIGTQDIEADLVISLLSWGWHYPLETYRVKAKTIICDIRDKVEGEMICPLVMHNKPKGHRCKLR